MLKIGAWFIQSLPDFWMHDSINAGLILNGVSLSELFKFSQGFNKNF